MHDQDEDVPVDFSPIDPSRDAPRWDATIAAVAARARARRRPTLARELVRRGVPAFVLAAAAAAAVWLARPRPRAAEAPPTASAREPADVIATWALTGGGDAIDLVSGGDHVGH